MFEWHDLLPLAERLAGETDDEAAGRSAINRAYHDAYHVAAAFVRAAGLLPTRHTHQRVWTALADDPDLERARVGRIGNRLRRRRTEADYRNPFLDDLHAQVRLVVAGARDVVETLDRLN